MKILYAAAILALTLSCENLDVVAKDSAASFAAMLEASGKPQSPGGGSAWALTAPDGSSRFIWSKNFKASSPYDVMVEVEAGPFIAAGLDPAKLGEGFTVAGGLITVGQKLGNEEFSSGAQESPLSSFAEIVKLRRDVIGYHMALDHYGVNLGGGSVFEWAKDMSTNDKDIVFVLSPVPLVSAGLDPRKIPQSSGWLFAKVTVDDENGKPIEVDKILKPFNLR
jgi:hypothetical protein